MNSYVETFAEDYEYTDIFYDEPPNLEKFLKSHHALANIQSYLDFEKQF